MFAETVFEMESEQTLSFLNRSLDLLDDALLLVDQIGTIASANCAYQRLSGCRPDDGLFTFLGRALSPAECQEVRSHLRENRAWTGMVLLPRKDTLRCEAELNLVPLGYGREGRGYFAATLRDLTTKVELEARLRQSQKMGAIGLLASGIAHDFNNLLQIIISYAELLQAGPQSEEALRQGLEHIVRAGDRAAELTRQLLSFGRPGEVAKIPLDVRPLIKETIKFLERTFPASIAIKYDFAPELPDILADPSQVFLVLLNLCVNARDAMKGAGCIRIGGKRRVLPDKEIDTACGDFVEISVSDTGCGIPSEQIDRIYDPFFTTKVNSKGTGLGLATVVDILNHHDGFIRCRSEVGVGTRFLVFLPVSRVEEVLSEETSVKGGLPRGNETILVVDDAEEVREVLTRELRSLGYVVRQARTGQEAYDFVLGAPYRADLILMDIQLPGLDGLQSCERIRQVLPSARVIFLSGYIDQDLKERIEESKAHGFIQKPVNFSLVARRVRQALDSP